jgi:hypothetical protein
MVVLAVYSIHGDFLAVGVRECPDLPADGVNGQDSLPAPEHRDDGGSV